MGVAGKRRRPVFYRGPVTAGDGGYLVPGFHIDENGIQELFHDPGGSVAEIMERAAYQVESEAKRSLLHAGTYHRYEPGHYVLYKGGKIYAWTRRLPGHTSSMPGEPPSGDTGTLMVSIGHSMTETDSGIGAEIGSPLDYAFWVELGTKLMFARPFLRPALHALGVEIGDEAPEITPGPPGRLRFTPLVGGH
jgi:hypothetical protein